MTTRYRVEYALKTHRRDQFIEWIKGLLAVPFVLYSQPHGIFTGDAVAGDEDDDAADAGVARTAGEAHRRYAEIFRDVEGMVDDHMRHQSEGPGGAPFPSKLKLLVPSVGPFFTHLPLEAAFRHQDRCRHISSRRFVAPSFNDVRLVLNSAQCMAVVGGGGGRAGGRAAGGGGGLRLATFDGDVTLYDDGQSLEPGSPVIPRLLDLLRRGVCVGIVTAAGYTTADRYYDRLHGLLDALAAAPPGDLAPARRDNLVVMGGEANYLFAFDAAAPHRLRPVPRAEWLTPEMAAWPEADIAALLAVGEAALRGCARGLALPAEVARKDRAVGILPRPGAGPIPRESLEETVLAVQKALELSPAGRRRRVPFCAFNGGRDVFVDIGDKSWGVAACQRWFGAAAGAGPIRGGDTLHVGDQFLSAGANDFRARSVGTTAWIASPAETVELLDELAGLMDGKLP